MATHLLENGFPLNSAGSTVRFIDIYQYNRLRYSSSRGSGSPQRRTAEADTVRQEAQSAFRNLLLADMETPEVVHRGRAYGIAITHTSGWKIAYSGDTMPSENLVKAGKDATLLIHEATLNDDEAEQAKIKGHSTFGEAWDVAVRYVPIGFALDFHS